MTTSTHPLTDQISSHERFQQRRDRFIRILTVALLIGAWVLVSEMHLVKPLFLPAPQNLWTAAKNLAGHLPEDLFASLVRRILPGFAIGVSLGTLIGVLMAMNRVGRAIFEPIVEILRPLPPLALIPLLILWLGIGYITQILLIAYGSFIIMVVNSYEAVRNVPPIYIHAATMLGAQSRQIFRKVIIPSIIPDVIAGIRVSAAASFGYCVAAELMGAMTGLGYRLVLARRYLMTENIIVILIVIAVLSFAIDYGVRKMDASLTSWKSRIGQK
jgi:ABC-type nitrate/sulfonate/bicarbonate transport system permease component